MDELNLSMAESKTTWKGEAHEDMAAAKTDNVRAADVIKTG